MGVLRCDRKGCENIMCDTYVAGAGYICEDCKEEFAEMYASKVSTEKEIMDSLTEFMEAEKNLSSNEEMSISEFFRKHSY